MDGRHAYYYLLLRGDVRVSDPYWAPWGDSETSHTGVLTRDEYLDLFWQYRNRNKGFAITRLLKGKVSKQTFFKNLYAYARDTTRRILEYDAARVHSPGKPIVFTGTTYLQRIEEKQ